MKSMGILQGMPEDNQLSLFEDLFNKNKKPDPKVSGFYSL